MYFKLYKSQLPVVEQAIETAALMLGTDKSPGYCLEMIRADFLAGLLLPRLLWHEPILCDPRKLRFERICDSNGATHEGVLMMRT